MASAFNRLFKELRRRKVFRVAIVYAVVAWGALQVAELTFERLGLPPWTVTLVLMLAILGFPIAVALAWAVEVTPQGGVRREMPAPDPRSPCCPSST